MKKMNSVCFKFSDPVLRCSLMYLRDHGVDLEAELREWSTARVKKDIADFCAGEEDS